MSPATPVPEAVGPVSFPDFLLARRMEILNVRRVFK
jgi:hypothetical protein